MTLTIWIYLMTFIGSCLTAVEAAIVGIPRIAPYYSRAEVSQSPSGILPQLFAGSDDFTLEASSTWITRDDVSETTTTPTNNLSHFDQGSVECIEKMLNNSIEIDYCLFQISSHSLKALTSMSQGQLILTSSFVNLRPVVLTKQDNVSSSPHWLTAPSYIKATYFVRVFHGSVWTMILISILVIGLVFFAFERSKPCDFSSNKQVTQLKSRPEPYDSLMLVVCPLFLQGHQCKSRAWASKVLVLFWFAFCLIIVLAYASGSYRLLFRTLDQIESIQSSQLPVVGQLDPVECQTSQIWCQTLANQMGVDISWSRSSNVVLTNQIDARSLLDQGWVEARLSCSINRLKIKEVIWPSVPLTFVAKSQQLANKMNSYIQEAEESGKLSQLLRGDPAERRLLTNHDDAICNPPDHDVDPSQTGVPIMLSTMKGPLVFILSGVILAILVHAAEFIYCMFIRNCNVATLLCRCILLVQSGRVRWRRCIMATLLIVFILSLYLHILYRQPENQYPVVSVNVYIKIK